MKRLTNQQFIDKANQVHSGKFNYSKVKYVNKKTKIIIICPKHGEFIKRADSHLYDNQGCTKCSKSKKISGLKKYRKEMSNNTKNTFVLRAQKVHEDKYDYFKTNYINSNTKITIICKKHGQFLQNPFDHLGGAGCPKCKACKIRDLKKSNTKEFINKARKIHGNRYDYSETDYKNNSTKIIIICKKHGKFFKTPNSHLFNQGCPKCSHKISKSGTKWLDKIEKQYNLKLKREYLIGIGKITIDGFDPKTNTCYEYYGNYWHGNPKTYKSSEINPSTKCSFGRLYQKTLKKEQLIKSAGYNLITKWGN